MNALARTLIGPIVVGTAVWCACGLVTLASPESAAVRLVLPAHAVWWVMGTLAGLSVRRWRREPITAMPAMLSTLPWWPLPLPAVALTWTGRAAWLPILVSLGLALWPRRTSTEGHQRSAGRMPRSRAALAGLLTALVGVGAAVSLAERLPGGDEPHYLVITQSLLADGDLRIENNHQRGDYRAYFSAELRPDFLRRGTDGEIYSIHAPGTSVLVLPAFALLGYPGAQATIILVAGLTGALIWAIGWGATGSETAAWFAWSAVTLSATFVLQSAMIFPDAPGALGTALGLWLVLRLSTAPSGVSARTLVGISLALAALPWLHTRFVVLSAALGVLVAWHVIGERTRPMSTRLIRLGVFIAVPALTAASWFWFFYATYGTPNPAAPYGPNPETKAAYVPGGMLGVLFDEQFGLLTYAPVLLAAVAAIGRQRSPHAGRAMPMWAGVAVAVLYIATVGTYWMWWAGVPATPARFAMAVLPAFAAPVAVGWHRSGFVGRAVWNWLLLVSIGFTGLLLFGGDGGLAWNVRVAPVQWMAWLSSAADLARGMPSFFWMLTPGEVATEIPFFAHVVVWCAVFGVTGALASRLWRTAPERAPLVGGSWLLLATMAALQAGWWLNGVSGLSPATSQFEALRRVERGAAVYRVTNLSVAGLGGVSGELRIRAMAPNGLRPSELPPVSIPDLPAGDYEISVRTRTPGPAVLTVRPSRNAEPIVTIDLQERTTASQRLALPTGAPALTLQPNQALSRAGEWVDLTPVRIERR